MNDNDKRHTGQCGVCGGLIEQGEDREEIIEGGEIVAYVHINCA